ncbi:MAG: hypothetical protein CBR30_07975 [Dictyoglomus sp. NZ13-RE01]|nr:MAG: hypothetical protein CBR30_07975 [Dictyoglomus sp. NZ13-RE01]
MSKKFLVFVLVLILGLFSLSFAQVQTKFKDVPPTHWAAPAVKYLTDLGIISGIRPDTFGGDMYVTRYQVAVLLYNLIQKLKLAEVALPAADIAELKNLVKDLSEELTLLGSRVDELMASLDELSGRVSDLESALEEKATLDDVRSVVEESLGDVTARLDDIEARVSDLESLVTERPTLDEVTSLIEEKISEIEIPDISDLEGRVSDLEGLAGDLDSRLSDVEVALTEKASVDDVQAMIEESLGDTVARLDDLEGRVSDLEGLAGDLDSRLSDVEVALTEKASVDDVQAMIEESLGDTVARLDDLEGRVSDLEGLAGDLDSRLSDVEVALTEKASVDDVQAMIEESLGDTVARLDDLEGRVSDLESQVAGLAEQVANIEKVEVTEEQIKTVIGEKLEETVKKVTEEALADLEGRVSDLEGLAGDLDSRLSDVEVALTEKASVDDVQAMIEESLGDTVARLDDVEGKVNDLELRVGDVESAITDLMGITDDLSANLTALSEKVDALEGVGAMVEDLDARVSDIEVLLTDRPTVDEVTAMIEEKLAEIQVPDVEELKAMVEDHSDAIDALRADVDAILTEELPSVKDAIAELQDKVSEIEDKLAQVEGVEVPEELADISSRLDNVESAINALYNVTDDLALSLSDLTDRVSSVEDAVADVNAKVDDINKALNKFAVSGSVSVKAKKDFGANKNIAITPSATINLGIKPADGVSISTSFELVNNKLSFNSFDVSVAQVEFGLKNLVLSYNAGADSNFAVDVNELVGTKTAKVVASVDLPAGLKLAVGLNGTDDGTGEDLVAGKVSGSFNNVDVNAFALVSRANTTAPYSYAFGSDFGTSVAKGIKLFGEAVYDGTFDVLGGVSLSDVGVKGLSSTLKATYKDNSLTLYGSASYPVTSQATVSAEVTVSDVTHTTRTYTVKGAVSGTVAPFSYEAYFVYPTYKTWAKVSGSVNPKTSVEAAFYAPNLTQFSKDTVSLVLKGTYSLTDKVTLWAWVTNNQDGKWFTDQGLSTYPGTASAMAEADYALTSNVTLNLSVYKLGLGNITKGDILPTDVTLKATVNF